MIVFLWIVLSAHDCDHAGAIDSTERVRIDRVVLLSTEAQMSANLTAEQLAAFIHNAQAQVA